MAEPPTPGPNPSPLPTFHEAVPSVVECLLIIYRVRHWDNHKNCIAAFLRGSIIFIEMGPSPLQRSLTTDCFTVVREDISTFIYFVFRFIFWRASAQTCDHTSKTFTYDSKLNINKLWYKRVIVWLSRIYRRYRYGYVAGIMDMLPWKESPIHDAAVNLLSVFCGGTTCEPVYYCMRLNSCTGKPITENMWAHQFMRYKTCLVRQRSSPGVMLRSSGLYLRFPGKQGSRHNYRFYRKAGLLHPNSGLDFTLVFRQEARSACVAINSLVEILKGVQLWATVGKTLLGGFQAIV